MEQREHRRKSRRYAVRWKAAAVFDKSAGKPILHTETEDLSVGGAAIHSDYGDLTGSTITLLVAQPPRDPGEQPRMLKLRALVVSNIQTPGKSGFRLGLSFIRAPDDGLESLEELLKQAADVQSASAPAAAAPAAPAPVPGGRLAALRQAAQAKLAAEKKPDSQDEINRKVSEALKRIGDYLKPLADELNVVKPPYNNKGYVIVGAPEFSGLAWQSGRADFRTKEISPTSKVYEQVSLAYRISGNKQVQVKREYPASEKLKQILSDYKLEFESHDRRNEKGSVVDTTFSFPCEVKASLIVEGNYQSGKLLLKMRNVEHFGMEEHLVSPEAVTPEALEELVGYILGETTRIGPLVAR